MNTKGKKRTPKIRHHKATGQAYAVLNGRAVYFGPYDTEEASQQYHKVIAEWLANGRQPEKAPEEITINELVARLWVHAEGYYRDLTGNPTTELGNLKVALRPMCDIYGSSRAVEFGPRALKTVRKRLIDRGLCRNHINKCISRIKMLFKWATAYLMKSHPDGFIDVKSLLMGRNFIDFSSFLYYISPRYSYIG